MRAEALRAVAAVFAEPETQANTRGAGGARREAEELLEIRGIGQWTIESALLWGVADADAHPTGDIALLRAASRWYPTIATLRDLDRTAETWRPHRGWAARLLWLDLLGFNGAPAGGVPGEPERDISH